MKIIPNTRGWNEGEYEWSFVEDASADITNWEQRAGVTIPAEYRNFMLKFNGGSVYPRMFITSIPDEKLPGGGESFVDTIYRWDQVESHWRKETYGDGVPPGFLVIAETPGGIEILLGLKGNDAGKLFAWVQSTDAWGTDRNTEMFLLASDFNTFLKMLYDDEEQSDYEAWHLPIYDQVAKDLEV